MVPRNPDPISKPLVDGIESMACARTASNLSKHGSPRPRGQFRMTQVTAPPRESSAALAALIAWLSASYSREILVEERNTTHIGHLLGSLLVGTPSQFLINLLPGNVLDQLQ